MEDPLGPVFYREAVLFWRSKIMLGPGKVSFAESFFFYGIRIKGPTVL